MSAENLALVKDNGMAIKHIKEQSYELCLTAVRQDGYALKYVQNEFKTYDLCLAAVQQDGMALEFVLVQNKEICLAAVRRDTQALKFVRDEFRCDELYAAVSKKCD